MFEDILLCFNLREGERSSFTSSPSASSSSSSLIMAHCYARKMAIVNHILNMHQDDKDRRSPKITPMNIHNFPTLFLSLLVFH